MAAVFHVSVTLVEVVSVDPFAGNRLVTHDGAVGNAAVVKFVKFASQPVDGPAELPGTIYQLYNEDGDKPVGLYVADVTVAVGVKGAVAPVHKYTS